MKRSNEKIEAVANDRFLNVFSIPQDLLDFCLFSDTKHYRPSNKDSADIFYDTMG